MFSFYQENLISAHILPPTVRSSKKKNNNSKMDLFRRAGFYQPDITRLIFRIGNGIFTIFPFSCLSHSLNIISWPFYFHQFYVYTTPHSQMENQRKRNTCWRTLFKWMSLFSALFFTEFFTWISFPFKILVSCSEWRFLLALRKYNNKWKLIIFTGKLNSLADRDSLHGKFSQYWNQIHCTYIKDELYVEILFSNSYVFD